MNFYLLGLLLHFSSNSVLSQVQIWAVESHKSSEMKAGVFHYRRLIMSVYRGTILMEDKELSRDLTHDRQYLLSQRHITAVWAINLNPRIDEYQVHFPEFGHADEHH